MKDFAKIDHALDETLVGLGTIVLRLATPSVTRTADERRALAKSVSQFALCANRSADPRVHELRAKLQETVRPRLKVVSSR
jgi:hypothetical protein